LEKRPASWKKAALFLAFLASHGLLFGTFYYFVFGSFKFKQDETTTNQEASESLATPASPSSSTSVLPERKAPRTIGSATKTDSVKASASVKAGPKTKSSSAQKKPNGARKTIGRGDAAMQSGSSLTSSA
jgi:hypothetical protein